MRSGGASGGARFACSRDRRLAVAAGRDRCGERRRASHRSQCAEVGFNDCERLAAGARMSDSPVLEGKSSTPTAGGEPLLRLDGICKRYGSFEALCGIDLQVRTGEVVAIIGPSGSGKSTLLRCINQLEPPTSGRVALGNVVIESGRQPSRSELMQLRRSVGMVFQSFNLFPHLT